MDKRHLGPSALCMLLPSWPGRHRGQDPKAAQGRTHRLTVQWIWQPPMM